MIVGLNGHPTMSKSGVSILKQLEKTERPERYAGTERFTPKETER